MHVGWNYPPCIQRCNKECCLLTLHWCCEVLFSDFRQHRHRIKTLLPNPRLCLHLFVPGHTVSGHFPGNLFPRCLPPAGSVRPRASFKGQKSSQRSCLAQTALWPGSCRAWCSSVKPHACLTGAPSAAAVEGCALSCAFLLSSPEDFLMGLWVATQGSPWALRCPAKGPPSSFSSVPGGSSSPLVS